MKDKIVIGTIEKLIKFLAGGKAVELAMQTISIYMQTDKMTNEEKHEAVYRKIKPYAKTAMKLVLDILIKILVAKMKGKLYAN